ncbi:FkbM family methyltransferase [Magnetospirillum sp. UT-4]|uniref:FkbM family methyltransferase n=1 Tax=Magnetospirillum sp. UT-4 TaxID=2681467 RepID=UPI001384BEA6|nr:FkbM family methyltransferase [Magnetospirillum sp. UT-4]CAA7613588.1 conserved hypothetical protein [Magnetospirillum sp. UT-4]
MSAGDLVDAGMRGVEDEGGEVTFAEVEAARAAGDLTGALALAGRLVAEDPDDPEALALRGGLHRALGHFRPALADLSKALGLDPSDRRVQLELALTLYQLGRLEEARAAYTILVRDTEAPAEAWRGLARLLQGEGRAAAAEAALRRAVAIAPDDLDARLHLADMLASRLDLAGAAELYHDVLAIDPTSAAAHAGLGQVLVEMGRGDEADDQFERALAMDPDNASARLGRARLNLLEGHLAAGWDDLEWRWHRSGANRPEPPGRTWSGDEDLAGSAILLWAERNPEETLHLLRYVPLVADKGARVILGLPAVLAPLGKAVRGVAAVAVSGQRLPPRLRIDFNASLNDLPRLFGTTLSSIPPAPYLEVPPGRRPPVTVPPTAALKVGVAWAGRRVAASTSLSQLLPLAGISGVVLFGLQTGERSRDVAALAHPALITDLAPTVGDYADLAGRIAEMDVVVTVDGAVAHLAGALGKPVWVMLPHAPGWHWMRGRADSPWYPSARLFRQDHPGDWNGVIARVRQALEAEVAEVAQRRADSARAATGEKALEKAFLTTHLRAGDLYVDIGAGAGDFACDAAAHPAGDIRVLAVEAHADDAAMLSDTIDIIGAADVVEVVAAALAGRPAPAVVAKVPRRGRSLFLLPDWVRAPARATTLDALLAERPDLAGRRLVVRLGVRGAEADILAGMAETLAAGRVAAVVFGHTEGGSAAEALAAAGFSLLRLPDGIAAGAAQPFAGEPGPTLALAPGCAAADLYGDVNDPASPAAAARAAAEAAGQAAEGSRLLMARDLNGAGRQFARALALDPANVEANANLGGLLRRIGRADAAAACWRRALAAGARPPVAGNLANVLRELGHYVESETVFTQAVAAAPNDPRILYAFALLERERGRARDSLALLERAEHLKPGTVPKVQLATALAKSGNLARGIAEMAHRPLAPLAPVAAPDWDGGRLEARTILVRDENDAIDTLMLARFLPQVARQGGLVTVECVPEAARLLSAIPGVEAAVARGKAPPPATDLTVRLLDVPRILGTTSRTTPPRDVPYIRLPDGVPPFRFPGGQLNVGIAWSGRERDRSLPLPMLLRLAADPAVSLVSLQRGPRADDLAAAGARPLVEEMGSLCRDLADVAAVIAGLDVIVACDTVEAHLAGAMGKPVWVLLPLGNDWRWVDGRDDSVWYPTMRVFRQSQTGSWAGALAKVADSVHALAAAKARR